MLRQMPANVPLEQRVCVTVDIDHTLTLETQQMPVIEDSFERIKHEYNGKPWRFVVNGVVREGVYKIEKPADWFQIPNSYSPPMNTRGYMNQFLRDIRKGVLPALTKKDLQDCGARVKLAPGATDFFQKLRERWQGKAHLYFNAISTGIYDIIAGMPMASEFDNIFANQVAALDGEVIDSSIDEIVPFSKSRCLIALAKGGEELVDTVVPAERMAVFYENMVCVGDGLSDVSHFAYVRKKGGYTVCVYPAESKESYLRAISNKDLMARVSLLVPRDFRVDSPIWNAINRRIERTLTYHCGFEKSTLDSYRKGRLGGERQASAEYHFSQCSNCSEDSGLITVPLGKNLAVQNGRLAVV